MRSELTLDNRQNAVGISTLKKDIMLRVDGASTNELYDVIIHKLSINQACSLIQMLLDGVKEVTKSNV